MKKLALSILLPLALIGCANPTANQSNAPVNGEERDIKVRLNNLFSTYTAAQMCEKAGVKGSVASTSQRIKDILATKPEIEPSFANQIIQQVNTLYLQAHQDPRARQEAAKTTALLMKHPQSERESICQRMIKDSLEAFKTEDLDAIDRL